MLLTSMFLVGGAAVALTDEFRRRCVKSFKEPLAHLDRSIDAAALEAERDRSQFRRHLEGTEGSLPSLWKQGESYLQWLAVALLKEFGPPPELTLVTDIQAVRRPRVRRGGGESEAA